MYRNRTTTTRPTPTIGSDTSVDTNEAEFARWIEAELRHWTDTDTSQPSTQRHSARQAREAASWVAAWLRELDRSGVCRTVELSALVAVAVEIVTIRWDDNATMRDVMWRAVIDGIDDGRLCFDLWVERVLLPAATRHLGC